MGESFLCHSHAVFGQQADHVLSGDAREKRAIRGRRKNHTVLGNEDVGGSKLNREHQTQSPINQIVLLWASAKLPGLLEHGKQETIINEVLSKQPADGGWSLSSLVGAESG